jgi:hypothetical protein
LEIGGESGFQMSGHGVSNMPGLIVSAERPRAKRGWRGNEVGTVGVYTTRVGAPKFC